MRSFLSFLFTLWLIVLTNICIGSPEPIFLTIATGGPQGNYYASGRSICDLINRNRDKHGIRCSVALSEGSLDNLKSIRANEYELGIVQSDWQYHAYQGTGHFAGRKAFTSLRSIFSLYQETFTIVAHTAAEIDQFEDLQSKRVDLGRRGSGTRATAEIVVESAGLRLENFQDVKELGSMERLDAICQNGLDALVMVVGHPNQVLKQTTGTCGSKIIGPGNEVIVKLLAKYPYLHQAYIPGGMYQGVVQAIPTVAVAATLVSKGDLPESVVYAVVEAVFENFDELKTRQPFFNDLKKPQMVSEALTAPLHPGALRYYQETGLISSKQLKSIPDK